MARGATEQRRPVWLKLVVSGVMIVGGVALAAVLVPQFLFSQTAEVALIRGDDAPFKIKPQDTGGTKIPHQETTVMGMLGGVSASNQDVEILTPPAAVPEMPPAPSRTASLLLSRQNRRCQHKLHPLLQQKPSNLKLRNQCRQAGLRAPQKKRRLI